MKKRLFGLILAFMLLFAFAGCEQEVPEGEIPEGSFTIVSPSDGDTDVQIYPTIGWTVEANADLYLVEIASDAAFENTVAEETAEGLSYTLSDPLDHAAKYYLRVIALSEEEGKTYALSYKQISFTTTAEHSTDAPDYTQPRTIYDFEEYTDTAALRERFTLHTAGDPLNIELAQTGGNAGSKGMSLSYTPGVNGWAGALSSLPADKKVWSGAKGIRFWIDTDGSGDTFEIRFGKRGFQSWSATFAMNNPDGMYVSVPFSAFEDAGGGDGILDLSGITRLWFFVQGSRPAQIVIDDVTIGSDENYTTDTRSAAEKANKAQLGTVDDFESYTDVSALDDKWTFESIGEKSLLQSGAFGGTQSLSLTPSAAWSTMGISMAYTDFSDVNSITFKASAGVYVVQLASGWNVIEKEIAAAYDGQTIGVNISELLPQTSSMTVNIGQIDLFRIGIKDKSGTAVTIDDVAYSSETFVPEDNKAGLLEDFETDGLNAFNTKWAATGTVAPSLVEKNGSKAISLAANGAFGLEATGYNLAALDFSDTVGVKMDITMNQSGKVLIQIGSYGNVYTYEKEFYGPANNIDCLVCDFDAMTLKQDGVSSGDLNKDAINFFRIDVTTYGEYTVTLDNIEFYGEDHDYAAVTVDDFESYTGDEDVRAAWNNTAVALTDVNGNKAMTLTTASGWNGLQFNFAGTGDIGSANDYQNCFAVRVKITAEQPAELTVKLTRWENGIEKKYNLVAGENVIVAYFTDLKGTALSDYILNSLTLGVTYYGTAEFTFDDVEFLRG